MVFGVLEERDEVADPHVVDAVAQPLAEVDEAREHHVAAVAAAVDRHALRVEIAVLVAVERVYHAIRDFGGVLEDDGPIQRGAALG